MAKPKAPDRFSDLEFEVDGEEIQPRRKPKKPPKRNAPKGTQ
jgi:hypothetical protein